MHHIWHWGNSTQAFPVPASTLAIAWEGRVSLASRRRTLSHCQNHTHQRRASASTSITTSTSSLNNQTNPDMKNNTHSTNQCANAPPSSPCPSPIMRRKRLSGPPALSSPIPNTVPVTPSSLSAPAVLSSPQPPLPSTPTSKRPPLARAPSSLKDNSVAHPPQASAPTTAVGSSASIILKSPSSTIGGVKSPTSTVGGSHLDLASADNVTLLSEISRLRKLVDRTVRRAEDAEIRISIIEGERQTLEKDLRREQRRNEELVALCTEQSLLLARPSRPWFRPNGFPQSSASAATSTPSPFFQSTSARPMHTLTSHPTTLRHIQLPSADVSTPAGDSLVKIDTTQAVLDTRSLQKSTSSLSVLTTINPLRDSPIIFLTPIQLRTRVGSWASDQAKIAATGSWLPVRSTSPTPTSPRKLITGRNDDESRTPSSRTRSLSNVTASSTSRAHMPSLRSRASDANLSLFAGASPRSPGATLRRVRSVDPSNQSLRERAVSSLPAHAEDVEEPRSRNDSGRPPLAPSLKAKSPSSRVASDGAVASGLLDGIDLSPSVTSVIKPPRSYTSRTDC
ncbi:hypothetical protein HDU67_004492 [Dinochytrium kinnereticum]|nr:hypothetical protein HDU67_004492 [Dinochytrium kinnereticum]